MKKLSIQKSYFRFTLAIGFLVFVVIIIRKIPLTRIVPQTTTSENNQQKLNTYINKTHNYTFNYSNNFLSLNETDREIHDYLTRQEVIMQYCPDEFKPNCAPVFGHFFSVRVYRDAKKPTPSHVISPSNFNQWVFEGSFSPLAQNPCILKHPRTKIANTTFQGKTAMLIEYSIDKEYCPEAFQWGYNNKVLMIDDENKTIHVEYRLASTKEGLEELEKVFSTFHLTE